MNSFYLLCMLFSKLGLIISSDVNREKCFERMTSTVCDYVLMAIIVYIWCTRRIVGLWRLNINYSDHFSFAKCYQGHKTACYFKMRCKYKIFSICLSFLSTTQYYNCKFRDLICLLNCWVIKGGGKILVQNKLMKYFYQNFENPYTAEKPCNIIQLWKVRHCRLKTKYIISIVISYSTVSTASLSCKW